MWLLDFLRRSLNRFAWLVAGEGFCTRRSRGLVRQDFAALRRQNLQVLTQAPPTKTNQGTLTDALISFGASGDTELFEKPSNINGFGLSDNFFSCIAS